MNKENERLLKGAELSNVTQWRSEVVITRKASYEAMDRAILALSSGGLALSATVLRAGVAAGTCQMYLLNVSTFAFFLAIVATLFSLVSSIRDHNEIYEKVNNAVKYERASPELWQETKHVKWTKGLNRLAFWTFLIAIALISLSVIIYN